MCRISRGRKFQTEGTAQEKERRPNVVVIICAMRRVLEFEEMLSCLDAEYAQKMTRQRRGCIRQKGMAKS